MVKLLKFWKRKLIHHEKSIPTLISWNPTHFLLFPRIEYSKIDINSWVQWQRCSKELWTFKWHHAEKKMVMAVENISFIPFSLSLLRSLVYSCGFNLYPCDISNRDLHFILNEPKCWERIRNYCKVESIERPFGCISSF